MGLTYVPAVVLGPKGRAALKFLVDSGASLTVLPHPIWRRLGLKSGREMIFTLADGTEVKRKISECRIQILEFKSHTPVILGEPSDTALLGAITLEILGLKINPFTRRLEPLHMMLAASGAGTYSSPRLYTPRRTLRVRPSESSTTTSAPAATEPSRL